MLYLKKELYALLLRKSIEENVDVYNIIVEALVEKLDFQHEHDWHNYVKRGVVDRQVCVRCGLFRGRPDE